MSDFRQGPTWPIPPDVFQSRIADLERQLAEARAEVDRYKDHAHQRELEALTLGSQLAEKQAEIEAMRRWRGVWRR